MTKTGTCVNRNDLFSSQTPSFNLEGTQAVGTPIGMMLTVICTICMLIYFSFKTIVVFTQLNPNLSSIQIDNLYDADEHEISLNEKGFNMAFSVYNKKEVKDDPSMVEFEVTLIERNSTSNVIANIILGNHRCSKQELDAMHPPHPN